MVTTRVTTSQGVVFLVTVVLTPVSRSESGCWRAFHIAAMMRACSRSRLA